MNCKPKNQDEQEIPFRLQEIMRSRQEMKNPVSNKKRKKDGKVRAHVCGKRSLIAQISNGVSGLRVHAEH